MSEKFPVPMNPDNDIEIVTERILVTISGLENEYGNDYQLIIQKLDIFLKKMEEDSLEHRVLEMLRGIYETLNKSIKLPGNKVTFDQIMSFPTIHPDGDRDVQLVLKNLARQKIGRR